MNGSSSETLIAIILTMNRTVPLYILPIVALFSLAITALLGRSRTALELVGIFFLVFFSCCALMLIVFTLLVGRPLVIFETVAFP